MFLTTFIFGMYDLHKEFQAKGGIYRVTTMINKTRGFINLIQLPLIHRASRFEFIRPFQKRTIKTFNIHPK